MGPPENKPASNSNSIVVLVMFVAVMATAGVLYSVLEEAAPPRKVAYTPPTDSPIAAPAETPKPALGAEPNPQVRAIPPSTQAPRAQASRPKASPTRVAKKPRPAPQKRDVPLDQPLQAEAPKQTPAVPHARALSPDQRLQAEVMNAIRRTGSLHGSIAVEAKDGVVHLNGWTLTPGEAYRAANAARRVKDVKEVQNDIRPRMSGSV